MKDVTYDQADDLTTAIQNVQQIALVVNETALNLTRAADGRWYLSDKDTDRLCAFSKMLVEASAEVWRKACEITEA